MDIVCKFGHVSGFVIFEGDVLPLVNRGTYRIEMTMSFALGLGDVELVVRMKVQKEPLKLGNDAPFCHMDLCGAIDRLDPFPDYSEMILADEVGLVEDNDICV